MKGWENLEQDIEKKLKQKDKRMAKKMKISGKSVFYLKKIIAKKAK